MEQNYYKEQSKRMLYSSQYIYPKDFVQKYEYEKGDDLDYERFILFLDLSKAIFTFSCFSGNGLDSLFHQHHKGTGYFFVNFEQKLEIHFSEIKEYDVNHKETKTDKKYTSYVTIKCTGYDSLINVLEFSLDYFKTKYPLKMKKSKKKYQERIIKSLNLHLNLSDTTFQYL